MMDWILHSLRLWWTIVVLSNCVLLGAQRLSQSTPRIPFQLEETLLGTLPGTIRGQLHTSPGNRHVFATVQFGGTVDRTSSGAWAVYRDGMLVGRYDGKLPTASYYAEGSEPGVHILFSKDGEHYAFIAERSGKQFVVHDGAEDTPYDAISRLLLSPTGLRVSYVVGQTGERRLVLDGHEGPESYDVYGQFSSDGQHFAWTTSTKTTQRVFWDGVPQTGAAEQSGAQAGYSSIDLVTFSSDSQHLAFVAHGPQGSHVTLDGKLVGTYPGGIESLAFSPDSRHVAFESGRGPANKTDRILVVDGEQRSIADTSCCRLPFLAWSVDGEHLAYAERRDSGAGYPMKANRDAIWRCPTACFRMVLDGAESPPYFDMDTARARFLPDGRLVYSAFDGTSWITAIGTERLQGFLVAITPDGLHRAFASGPSSNVFHVDGRQYGGPVSRDCCYVQFSGPAGKHVIYSVPDVGFVDGMRLPGVNALFTPDEEHVASIRENDVWVDGIWVLPPGTSQPRFSFDSNDRFHVFALRGNQVIRVDGRY